MKIENVDKMTSLVLSREKIRKGFNQLEYKFDKDIFTQIFKGNMSNLPLIVEKRMRDALRNALLIELAEIDRELESL